MFEYTICNRADKKLFYQQCEALKKRFPDMRAQKLLEDVNGTLVQQYQHMLGQIVVKNDVEVDALYIDAEFDLLPFFEKREEGTV